MYSGAVEMSTQTHCFTWQGIRIVVVYNPRPWKGTAHMEIRSVLPEGAALPITETGYLSYFHEAGLVEENDGTLVEQVRWWLDERAKSKHWIKYLEASRQGELF